MFRLSLRLFLMTVGALACGLFLLDALAGRDSRLAAQTPLECTSKVQTFPGPTLELSCEAGFTAVFGSCLGTTVVENKSSPNDLLDGRLPNNLKTTASLRRAPF